MSWTRLRYAAAIDPPKSEVRHLPAETVVSFLPMADVGLGGELQPAEERSLAAVYDGYTYLAPGDVAIATISPSFQNGKGGVLRRATSGICFATTELTPLRPRPGTDPRFLLYVLQSAPFVDGGIARLYGVAGQQRVPTDYLRDYRLWLPSLRVQHEIADYLDRETQRIAALIDKNERMTTLLIERFKVSRANLLSGGASSGTSTDLPWNPLLPNDKGWSLTRLKRACRLQRGHDLPVQDRAPGPYPVVSSGGVIDYHDTSISDGPGVVTGRYGTVGEVYYVDSPYWPLNTALYVIDFQGNDARYVFHLLSAVPLKAEADKSAVDGINRNVIHEIPVVLAPREEQAAIARAIDAEAERTRKLTSSLHDQNKALTERRRALITAAVTGQLDIGEVA